MLQPCSRSCTVSIQTCFALPELVINSPCAPTGWAALLQVAGSIHPDALENIGLPLYIIDQHGVFRWINLAARTLHGDIVSRQFITVVAPERIGDARRQFARKVTGQAAATDYGLILRDRTGRRVAVQIHSVALPFEGSGAAVFGAAIPESTETTPDSLTSHDQSALVKLTQRQKETLLLLADGLGTCEIASHLVISVQTARNHIRAVMSALDAHSRLEAVAIARRIGLL
jgi:DNA-binding CsgD family transcriptional regulator